jgi:hypothetical protein
MASESDPSESSEIKEQSPEFTGINVSGSMSAKCTEAEELCASLKPDENLSIATIDDVIAIDATDQSTKRKVDEGEEEELRETDDQQEHEEDDEGGRRKKRVKDDSITTNGVIVEMATNDVAEGPNNEDPGQSCCIKMRGLPWNTEIAGVIDFFEG